MGLDNLRRLGNQFSIPLPRDPEGFLGRECPNLECEGYFKIKPGTGLKGTDLRCHCPYCGQSGPARTFGTKEQIEYAKSVVLGKVTDAIRQDLKSMEFEVKPRGPLGIGISMKVQAGRPVSIRHYREKALETHVVCDACTLEYAVYGVFAFCPDCGVHNSLLILDRNLDLVRKQLALASGQSEELARQLIENGLEDCVSSFDGFARECCRVRAAKSSDPGGAENLSLQNLARATKRLQGLFAIDLEGAVSKTDWQAAHVAFMRRHVLAHRSGVVDHQYLDETGDSPGLLGRRLRIEAGDVIELTRVVHRVARVLLELLPDPR